MKSFTIELNNQNIYMWLAEFLYAPIPEKTKQDILTHLNRESPFGREIMECFNAYMYIMRKYVWKD